MSPMRIIQPSILCLALVSLVLPAFSEEMESITVSEFSFQYGSPWARQQVVSTMRAGQFTYDHEDEALKDVDLVIYFFGAGQGGGTQANIDRWIGQFEGSPETKIEEKELGEKKVTFLTAKGTYKETMGGPFSGNSVSQADYTMLAAILPSPQGDVFLKLTGPNDSVAAMKDAFDAFAASPFEK